jgi:hypothetical protein
MTSRSPLSRGALVCLAGLASLVAACSPKGSTVRHDLAPTGGEVRFAVSREAFYKERWIRAAKADQPMVCAGFVHKEPFERLLKYGKFELEMTMEVFLGGEPVADGGRVSDWTGGKLLRTIVRRKAIGPTNNSYVWCGRLQKGGAWKLGAMRYAFVLRGPERAMDEPVARGTLPVRP